MTIPILSYGKAAFAAVFPQLSSTSAAARHMGMTATRVYVQMGKVQMAIWYMHVRSAVELEGGWLRMHDM